MSFDKIRLLIASALVVLVVLYAIGQFFKGKKIFSNQFIAKTAVFSSIAIILYIIPIFQFKLPFFPSFLEIHIDEIPALIAGFAYGPISGIIVILIKTVVKLPLTSTAGVGELADLIYSIAFVVPSAIVYKKMHSFKGAIIALSIGMVVQILTASFGTTFIMLDVYSRLYHLPKETILKICKVANPAIDNLVWPFFLMVGIPFNALKDAIVLILTLLLYKRLHRFIDKLSTKKLG